MKLILPALLFVPFIAGCPCASVRDDVEDFETQVEALREQFGGRECGSSTITGECSGGATFFISFFLIDARTTDFFDADNGEYLGSNFGG